MKNLRRRTTKEAITKAVTESSGEGEEEGSKGESWKKRMKSMEEPEAGRESGRKR